MFAALVPCEGLSAGNGFRYKAHMTGKWDAGMATFEHTPMGRGYDSFFGYYHHANDCALRNTRSTDSHTHALTLRALARSHARARLLAALAHAPICPEHHAADPDLCALAHHSRHCATCAQLDPFCFLLW